MRDYVPRAYGQLATDFLIENPRCALWASMGLGKSVITLQALWALREAGAMEKPTLILAPLRVARTGWPREVEKWSHLVDFKVVPVVGTAEQRQHMLARYWGADAYTCNYENLPWLIEHTAGIPWPFGAVVCDESTKLKSARVSVQTSKLGKKFIRAGGGSRASALAKVAFQSERFIELTGTPAPNGLQDLWGQAWFLDQGARLGKTFEAFTQRWFRLKRDGYGLEPLPFAQEQIQAAMRDLVLTLEAKDWFDLKKPIVNVIKVELPPSARKKYREMEKELFTILEGHEVSAANAAAKTIKCLQLCNGAAFVDEPDCYEAAAHQSRKWVEVHDEKLDALESVIEEAAGMPVLVGYHFKPDLQRLLKRFPEGRLLKSQKDEDDFKEGRIPVLFAHPQSAGHGIDGFQNITNQVCFFSSWWDAELHDQFIERIGAVRQLQAGHDRPVHIHYIVADRTIEEGVLERVHEKRDVQDILKDSMRRLAA